MEFSHAGKNPGILDGVAQAIDVFLGEYRKGNSW
jgi:hypothetical protein